MMFRPSKWLQFAPVVVLPLLAAWMVNGAAIRNDGLHLPAHYTGNTMLMVVPRPTRDLTLILP